MYGQIILGIAMIRNHIAPPIHEERQFKHRKLLPDEATNTGHNVAANQPTASSKKLLKRMGIF
jgi:hypothetical protein